MPTNIISNVMEKLTNFWTRLNISQRIFVAGFTVLVLIGFTAFMYWINQTDYQVLYSNLSAEDANKVVKTLETDKISYKIANNGTTILVAENQVYPQRIKIAGEGKLMGQGIGFEIFDEVQVGQTDFVQKINYQRALQGELSRTLSEFPNVESARVHLVIPQRSLFIEEQQSPTASVVIKLEDPSVKMENKQVQAMVNLLSMSIQGLDKNKISINDSNGKPLYMVDDDSNGLNNTQLDYRLRLEQSLERRIDELLIPVLGPGKSIAKVNLTLDYSQRTIKREIFDPESSVIRSEQSSEENQIGRANLEGGSPDVNFRGDGIGGALSTQEGTRESRTRNYEINKEEQSIIGQAGEIINLSVAVVIDGTYARDENANWVYTPRSQEEMERIEALVANAVGLNQARGDSIEVSNMAFGEAEMPNEVNPVELISEFANRMGKPLINALLAFVFLMLVIRPLVMAIIRPRVESGEAIEGLEGLPSAEEQYALYEAQENAAREAEERAIATNRERESQMGAQAGMVDEFGNIDYSVMNLDEIKAKAMQLAERNMDITMTVVRGWMHENARG